MTSQCQDVVQPLRTGKLSCKSFKGMPVPALPVPPCILAVLADEQCFPFLGHTNTGHWSGKAGSSFLVCFHASELARALLQGLGWMNDLLLTGLVGAVWGSQITWVGQLER